MRKSLFGVQGEPCNEYNQYYTDIVVDNKLVTMKCFDGK